MNRLLFAVLAIGATSLVIPAYAYCPPECATRAQVHSQMPSNASVQGNVQAPAPTLPAPQPAAAPVTNPHAINMSAPYMGTPPTQTNVKPLSTSAPPATNATKPIPAWVKSLFFWYGRGSISDSELIGAIQFLVQQGIIQLK